MIVPTPSTRALLEEATSLYEKTLETDDEALTYLGERGITSTARSFFRLGVVRESISGQEKFQNRLAFPYVTPTGVTAIRFRTIGEPGERAKMLAVAGDIQRLYNTRSLMKGREVYICEGETDTIAAHQSGLLAVGLPGVSAWSKNARVFARVFANRTVTVLADNDDAGQGMEFAEDIYRSLGGCAITLLPEGYDVSRFYNEHGPEELRKLCNKK